MLKYLKLSTIIICLVVCISGIFTPLCYGDLVIFPEKYEEAFRGSLEEGVSIEEYIREDAESHNTTVEKYLKYLKDYRSYYLSFEEYQLHEKIKNIPFYIIVGLWVIALCVVVIKIIKTRKLKNEEIVINAEEMGEVGEVGGSEHDEV